MTHEDKGHYAGKHPPDLEAKPEIMEVVKQKASNGEISCTAAHKIAEDLKVSPSEVGLAIDLLDNSIVKCQLGLFGYGPERKIIQQAETVSQALENNIRDSMIEGRLSCEAAWKIAVRLKIGKMEVSAACENKKVKISSCQLGAF